MFAGSAGGCDAISWRSAPRIGPTKVSTSSGGPTKSSIASIGAPCWRDPFGAKRRLKLRSAWRIKSRALRLTHPSSQHPTILVEVFNCDADGYPMEGIWIQKLNAQGQINDLTVYLRPYPAVTVLRNRTKELGEGKGLLIGRDQWELPTTVS
jgi:hypothetical protein